MKIIRLSDVYSVRQERRPDTANWGEQERYDRYSIPGAQVAKCDKRNETTAESLESSTLVLFW